MNNSSSPATPKTVNEDNVFASTQKKNQLLSSVEPKNTLDAVIVRIIKGIAIRNFVFFHTK